MDRLTYFMLVSCWKVRREDIHDFMRWTFIDVVVALMKHSISGLGSTVLQKRPGVDPSLHGGEAGRNPGGVDT